MVETVIVESEQSDTLPGGFSVSWPAIVAGAFVTVAGGLLLLALGSGLGFSVVNPWSFGAGLADETTKAATVAGIYLTATAVLASAIGGYVTGRLRVAWIGVHPHEAVFRDTAHGFVTWAVATVAGMTLLGSLASGIAGGALLGAVGVSSSPSPTMSASGGPLGDYVDQLFAYDEAHPDARPAGRDLNADTAIAHRLLVGSAIKARPLNEAEHKRLAAMVAARTGMDMAAADKRVAAVDSETRNAAEMARRVAARLSFWLVASMFAGALASSLAAWEGGAIRDGRLRYGD